MKGQKMTYLRSSGGWVGLIGLLIVVGIAAFLFIFCMHSAGKQEEGAAQAVGVDVSSQVSAYHSTVSQIEKINEHNKKRGDDLMRDIEAMQQY